MKRTENTAPRHANAPKRKAIARFRSLVVVTVLAMVAALLPLGLLSPAQGATVGQGFTVTPADLAFILKQIKIAEAHVAAGPGPAATDPVNCQAMIGTGPNQINSPLLTLGLRTVDGTCNNLQPGQEKYGAADMTFPRLTKPEFNAAEASTSYAQTSGSVTDSEPRTVSNLIVDQTVNNPAAVSAATTPVRSQSGALVLCTGGPSDPADCLPATGSLDIPNVTTDVGLSPPFNSLFTIFGQFFDHGLDKITNGGNGAVFVPLKADDPLRTVGPDGDPSTNDAVPASQAFMVVTRGSIVEGADGLRNAPNTDTPFVDQSQTYTSHASHQVFLREYEVPVGGGRPRSTGKFLSTSDGEGLATWAMIKAQAASKLGLQLSDSDVGNIPMIAADAYGRFIPGPARGLPQYVTATGMVEGNTAAPVSVPANVFRIDTAFLNDIAHSAAPTSGGPDADSTAGGSLDTPAPAGSYDNELLDMHAICGDGRCNENIALQAVHQIFHNEHDRLIDDIKATLGATPDADWTRQAREPASAGPVAGVPDSGWGYGERLFQAARFVTEMEYQHLVFEEFARKVQPGINPFEPFAFGQTDINPAITAEFAHAVYRFGHSMLTDTIPRINPTTGANFPIDLLDGFLNPAAYTQATTNGPSGALTPKQAAGAIIMGLSDEVGQEIDEFVVDTLRNNLLGLPLDLPAINMARARSEGVPPLNEVRRQIFANTNDGAMKPYTDWVDFGQQLKHPESLVNFVAAYGTHPTITSATTLAGRRAAAKLIVNPGTGEVQPADSGDFMFGTNYDETADNTPAVPEVPAGPGPDGVLGDNPATLCTGPNDPVGCDEGADDTPAVPAVPAGPGLDGIMDAVSNAATNWANVGGKTVTGVDDIDLWMGGLAERTNLFGGLLGSTFNYVFEKQLTDLQNGDRFYYLARTPGMNLRAQLEGNSFSELVMRNTDARNLKADPFATADCKFDLQNITWPATAVGSSGKLITGPGSVQDDGASECDENEHLLRMADGTIRYRMTNTAMPSGINAQAVYDGKRGSVVDKIWGGADNDTFWGREANDIIEGGDGADVALGGEGNDIITDLAGDDVPKGGPGNDAIDGGPGLDILMGGDGKDFMNGGANTNETFGGAGDDFVIAGEGMDAVFGDSGDDWVEGGDQPDLMIGDSSSFFFDDHNLPGHDILIGQGGDDDYDHEGGDDIGVAGPGVEKTAGAAGFDWQIGLGDPQAQDMDLAQVFVAGGVIAPGVRDKFNEVEALSGGNLNDTLRGDDVVPTAVGGGGFVGCDALDQAGVDRIAGLNQLVPALDTLVPNVVVASGPIKEASATQNCLLTGNVWGAGNILLGGSGSDLLEGRGADDIIDGDRYVSVRLSVRNPASPGTEIGTTDRMAGTPKSGNFGAGTAGMTLQQAVFAGLVDPGNIVAVREILTSTTANTDVALFSGPRTDYEITLGTAGGEPFVTVSHTGGTAADGIDTLRNVETLRFTTGDVPVTSITAPVPVAEIAPVATLAFGLRDIGSTTPLPVVVTNTGLAPLTVSSAVVSPAGRFTVASNNCTTVAPAGTCTISVAFAPTTTVAQTAQLTIVHNAAGSPRTITLTGQGQTPVVRPVMTLPATTAFGRRVVGTNRTQSVRVVNQGPGVLTITSVSATGQFTATRGTCTAPVAVGRTCNLAVTFRPTIIGPATGTLSVVSNAVGNPRTAALTGTGR